MAKIISKKYKILALILALVLISTSIPLTILGMENMKANNITYENASSEDKRIASEISNETGLSIEEVFELKSYGRSWNDVLTVLRNKSTLGENSKKNDRDDLLLNTGLDDEFIQKLKKDGFSEDDITEVKLIEERVMFQLEEITSKAQINPTESLNPLSENDKSSDIDLADYQELYEKIDIKNAIYFMLKLKDDFGGNEKVFDEYLFSLQVDMDLNDFIKDKEAYKKMKDEKKIKLGDQKVITLEKIEAKSIERAKTESKENNLSSDQNQTIDKTQNPVTAKETSPLPDVPKPDSVDVKPKNPTDEIMNEIKEINPIENLN